MKSRVKCKTEFPDVMLTCAHMQDAKEEEEKIFQACIFP